MRKLRPCTCAVLEAMGTKHTCSPHGSEIVELSLACGFGHGLLVAQATIYNAKQLIKALASLGSGYAKQARHHYQQPHEEKQLY